MKKVLNIYKPQGITPYQLIIGFRNSNPEYNDAKIGFAGRLDPLAHGVMLLLTGEENKNREKYLGLNKTYRFTVLFGISTDTYDYLGILDNLIPRPVPADLPVRIEEFLKLHKGELNQFYPAYSSKTVGGIQLFKLAKKNKLKGVNIPSRKVTVYDFELIGIRSLESTGAKKEMLKNLTAIRGHFRQSKIIRQWRDFFTHTDVNQFVAADFLISCSSGTYVRSLVNQMGEQFGCGAIAFEILRTRVGKYNLKDSLRLSVNY